MLRRFFGFALVVALVAPNTSVLTARTVVRQAPATGQISGTATNAAGQPMPNTVARLRDVQTGRLVASTRTNATGQFVFTGLNSGRYVVEVVDAAGRVVAASAAISLTTGAMIASGVTVAVSAVAATAASTAGSALGFFGTTAGIITSAAIAAGATIAVVAARGPASPSR